MNDKEELFDLETQIIFNIADEHKKRHDRMLFNYFVQWSKECGYFSNFETRV